MRRIRRLAPVLVMATTIAACATTSTPTGPEPFDEAAEVTALFVGNSLTLANDLPGMVAQIAGAAGRSFDYRVIARGGTSLEDHWNAGAADVIRRLRPDVVVLQQGPSSLPDNQAYLRSWTETFAPVVREAGGEPALFMVWPGSNRSHAFDAVRAAYRNAALAVDGLFVPAGEAWRAVWEADPDQALYGADGFHPSRRGSLVAALTVFAVVFDEDVRGLPAMEVSGEEAEVYYEAVQGAVETWSSESPAER